MDVNAVTPTPLADGPERVTVPEAARLFGVSAMTAYRWVKSGDLPALQLHVGCRVVTRVALADIERIIADARARSVMSPDTAELLEWMAKHHRDQVELCTRCAAKSKDPQSPYGWCVRCTSEHEIAKDEKRDRERARQRRWWNENGPAWRQDRKAKAKAAKASG